MIAAPRRLLPLLLFALGLLISGCGDRPPLPSDPGVVRFDASQASATVELGNPGPSAQAITGLRIEGPDWVAFQIVNEENPQRIGPGSTVQIHLRVDRKAFRTDPSEAGAPPGQEGYATFRAGEAALSFELEGEPRAVPLRFEPHGAGTGLASLLAGLMALAALALAVAIVGLRTRLARPSGGPEVALVLATLGVAWCTLPLADAVCANDLAAAVGALGEARCRGGLGGGPAAMLPGPVPGLGAILALLLAPLLISPAHTGGGRVATLLAALALGLAAAAIVLPEATRLGMAVPVALGAAAIVTANEDTTDSWLTIGWDLLATATLVSLVLDRLPLPLAETWPHGGVLAMHALVVGAMTGTLTLLVSLVRVRTRRGTERSGAARRAGSLAVMAAAWLLVQATATSLEWVLLGAGQP